MRQSLAPQGPALATTTWTDDVESGEGPGYRRTGAFEPNEWAVVSDANTRGGSAWRVPGAEGGTAVDAGGEVDPHRVAGAQFRRASAKAIRHRSIAS